MIVSRAKGSASVMILGMFAVIEGCADGGSRLHAATLQQAVNAYTNLDLEAARDGFNRILEDESIKKDDRAEAARRLARIAWRFDKKPDDSRRLLRRAEELGLDRSKVLYEEALAFLAGGDHSGAQRSALLAYQEADLKSEGVEAASLFARSVVEEAMSLGGRAGLEPAHAARLSRAHDLMRELVEAEPGLLEASRWLLASALMVGDGRSALTGWRSYYRVLPAGEQEIPALDEAEATLSLELMKWKMPPRSSEMTRSVVIALAKSGFHRIAAWIAETDEDVQTDEDIRAVVAYGDFLDRVEEATREYYRLHALGLGSRREFRAEFGRAARELWGRLPWRDGAPSFSEAKLLEETGKRFGTSFKFEDHDGALCLHLGFSLIDREYSVEQYGHRARLRFIALDHMISNGYNSWFWHGAASAGGWVDEQGSIVQVRPVYSEAPLKAWRQVRFTEEIKEQEKEIEKKSRDDDEIAAKNPYAYLPGLALRLRQRGYRRVLSELESRGVPEHELRDSFTRELARRVHASSILAHEGRHAIDKRAALSFLRSHAEKEYRAKLSEVALAPDPGLALTGGILFPNIGGISSHGQANERIVKILVEWMKAHEGEIEGLDRARPHLAQLDLLTDEQLRSALREVDPLAR